MESKKILIVDDDPQVIHLIEMMLHKFRPYDIIETALSCKDALNRLKSIHFDMIISDCRLPDGDGKIILSQAPPTTYRVCISGTHGQDDFRSSCDRFVQKPFGLPEIKSIITEANLDIN